MLPSRTSEEESNKISAGENVLAIKTPQGLYIRTKKGRIYAVHSGNQPGRSASAAWRSDILSMPAVQQSLPSSVCQPGSTRSLLDAWGSSSSGVDVYKNMQYNTTPRVTSMSNGDLYGDRYMPQSLSAQSGLQTSMFSSDSTSNSRNNDAVFSLNDAQSYRRNFAWNSSETYQSMADEASAKVPFSRMNYHRQQQQQHTEDSSRCFINNTARQSSSCTDLPSDLMCIDTSSMTDRTEVSDPTLPTLTVRQQQNDTDSLDSLTFDDYNSVAYNSMDPLISGYQSSPRNTQSNFNSTAASSLSSVTAATAGVLDIGEMSDMSADWNELSAMMSDN